MGLATDVIAVLCQSHRLSCINYSIADQSVSANSTRISPSSTELVDLAFILFYYSSAFFYLETKPSIFSDIAMLKLSEFNSKEQSKSLFTSREAIYDFGRAVKVTLRKRMVFGTVPICSSRGEPRGCLCTWSAVAAYEWVYSEGPVS